jgi:hypothetical protein
MGIPAQHLADIMNTKAEQALNLGASDQWSNSTEWT